MIRLTPLGLWCVAMCTLGAPPVHAQSYRVTHSYTLGGDGGWDYVALDTAGHRLFIARSTRVMVVDPETGKLLAELPGLHRAHGVAFAYAAGHGFVTSGGDSAVVMFDLRSLQVLGQAKTGANADAILFDPASGHVFAFNAGAGTASVIDVVTGRSIGTVELGGAPEFGVSTGDGRLYVNLVDSGAVAEIDPVAMKVTRRWSLGECRSPTGLAIDQAHHRLFSGCRNQMMAISDAVAGKVIATVPIGRGVDACRFDPATQLAFASNGGGTLTVVHEDGPDQFRVVDSVPTRYGARTMELDERTHRVYTVTADFGPPPERALVAGTFALLVLERSP